MRQLGAARFPVEGRWFGLSLSLSLRAPGSDGDDGMQCSAKGKNTGHLNAAKQ